MTMAQIEIQALAALVALACAIPGTFLVLRKMSMISDAISHAILPGIVIGFFISQDLSSPILILCATLCGLLTVTLVEAISKTKLVKEDAAIGLVFPALFSIGIILISRYANDVHLDNDAVLLGEIAFAPFNRLYIGGFDLGPKAIWVMASILALTTTLLLLFYKELKVATFDAELAASMGFSPVIIHYGIMTITSVTSVGAFDAVGAVLVIAFMITPAAAAYLLTDKLSRMLLIACLIGVVSAISGYWLARWLDASIAGSMTTMLGIIFLLVFLFSPNKGIIAFQIQKRQRRREFSLLTFLLHLKNHSGEQDDPQEREQEHLNHHFSWGVKYAQSIVKLANNNNMIAVDHNIISLTEKGDEFTQQALNYILTNKNTELESMKSRFLLFRA